MSPFRANLARICCCGGLLVLGGLALALEDPRASQTQSQGTDQAQSAASEPARPDAPGPANDALSADDAAPKFTVESLRGRVVWMAEAMQRLHEVSCDDDVAQSLVALETESGELFGLVKDVRGRAFHLDSRLRDIDVELLVRRYPQAPLVKIIRVYSLRDGKKYELDYWCDICAIQMFHLKPCECCQGQIRIRERLVEK